MTKDMNQNLCEKPWGNFRTLWVESGFQVKRIEVNSGARLSLQKHKRRSEKWTTVSGEGLAVVDGKEYPVCSGISLDIPTGVTHRMANSGEKPLIFIEVQLGQYLGEDDIVRLEDDYNRQ